MKVLIDIVDTGHVQFFCPIIKQLIAEGHQIMVTARDKDITLYLLEKFEIPYESISRMERGLTGLALELVRRDFRLFKIVRQFKPDVILAQTGVSAGIVGFLSGIPTVVLEEAEHAKLQRMVSLPFVSRIMTGTGYLHDHGRKQRHFRGIWVQSYLKPGLFTPRKEPLLEAGVDPEKPYIVLRTVAWEAAHDVHHEGVDEQTLIETVERLKPYGRVLISAEKELPDSLKEHANPVCPEQIHHLLAFAKLYIGEGGTMAAESAVMGVPAIFCNPLKCGYLLALEKEYDLLYNVPSLRGGVQIAERLLKMEDLKDHWTRKSERLWDETDDIVDFVLETAKEAVSLTTGSDADASDGSERWENSPKRKKFAWKSLIYMLLTAIVFFFVGRSIWQGIRQLDWSTFKPNYLWVCAAVGCFIIHRFLTGSTFFLILRSFGQNIAMTRAIMIEWISGLGQYIPGKIVSFTSLVALLAQSGVRTSFAMALSVFPMALTTLLGLLCSAPLFLVEPLNRHLNGSGSLLAVILVLIGGIVLIPGVFINIINFLLRQMRRSEIKASLNHRYFFIATGLVLLRFAMLGLGGICLAKAVSVVSWSHYPFFTCAMVGSSVVGFLAFFAPAGLGVREGILLLLLTPLQGEAMASVLILLIRVLQMIVDGIVGGGGLVFLRKAGLKKRL